MSDVTTHHIRVGATAYYLPDESNPQADEYFFGYRIVIHNTGPTTVQLLTRHWNIIDGQGHHHIVDGPGVVGEQPILKPDQAFKYTSFTRLETSWGTMEGHYEIRDDQGTLFQIPIERFYLTREMHEEPTD